MYRIVTVRRPKKRQPIALGSMKLQESSIDDNSGSTRNHGLFLYSHLGHFSKVYRQCDTIHRLQRSSHAVV